MARLRISEFEIMLEQNDALANCRLMFGTALITGSHCLSIPSLRRGARLMAVRVKFSLQFLNTF